MAEEYNRFNLPASQRIITPEEGNRVQMIMREFSQLVGAKAVFAAHCEEVAALILPTSRNTFMYGSYNTPGEKKTQQQVDATGMMALSRFAAICDSLLTPRNMTWHGLEANDEYVMKDRATRVWFEKTTRTLFKLRYAPHGNFSSQNQSNYQSLGAFGNNAMFIDKFFGRHGERGFRYKAIPFGEIYFRENHQGVIDGFVRHLRYTALQAYQKWSTTFPDALRTALEQNSQQVFDFLHYCVPNEERDPERFDHKGMVYQSCYVSIQGQCIVQEGGYNSFPIAPGRFDQTPGEVYGRGPAMMVLPALKTLNAEKRTFLTQGHRAANPVYFVHDDGMVDASMRPGAFNKGGVTSEGKPLVHMLPTGDIQISKEMMQEEKALINDAFLVNLFQILTESPQMTATEVIERTNEKGILLAPTVGRQQSEYLGPMIDRELDLASQLGLLEPMPPRLKEANGEYAVVYTSPMSKTMRASEAAGFWRTVDQAANVVNITQDPQYFDPFNFTEAIERTAEINGALPSFMASPEEMLQKRKERAERLKKQEAIQAAPGAAAMMKAKAVQQEKATPGQPQQ